MFFFSSPETSEGFLPLAAVFFFVNFLGLVLAQSFSLPRGFSLLLQLAFFPLSPPISTDLTFMLLDVASLVNFEKFAIEFGFNCSLFFFLNLGFCLDLQKPIWIFCLEFAFFYFLAYFFHKKKLFKWHQMRRIGRISGRNNTKTSKRVKLLVAEEIFFSRAWPPSVPVMLL